MSGTGLIQVKIQEKVDAIPGERVCAVGLLKNLTLGATIDYAAKIKTHEILRESRSRMERVSEQH